MRRVFVLSLLLAMSAMPVATLDSEAKAKGVSSSVVIAAPPHIVWAAVADQRKTDPDLIYSKVLSRNGNVVTIEQKFGRLPMLGEAVATIRADEVPHERIDYHMIKSDKFKSMSGCWVFKAVDKQSTHLELTNFVDTGLPQFIVNQVTKNKVKQRLANVQAAAERAARSLSLKSKPDDQVSEPWRRHRNR
jgi:hypothetical protein